jgi:putative ABC transport system substrate-binding protein
MQRREFITLLGSAAAAWPFAARAQQRSMPVIGFLSSASPDGFTERLRGFRRGLSEAGYLEGENVAIEYRWAEGQLDRLPALAADLVRRRVAVIAAPSTSHLALTARAATTTIPIVFAVGEDPVRLGLVTNLARPTGNLTGVNFFTQEVGAKRLELLHELVPSTVRVAGIVNPTDAASAEATGRELNTAARALGLQVKIHKASTSGEIDAVFSGFVNERPDAVFLMGNAFFNSRRAQLTHLASHYRLPMAYPSRDYPDIGGLMSYGTNITDAYRQVGVYTGRILKGARAADLPVVQSTKFELVINHQTARMLGLTVPPLLLTIADEVIE